MTGPTLLADGLGFAEGPLCLPDDTIVFCDCQRGDLWAWEQGRIRQFATTGGSPAAVIRGWDDNFLVTQTGGLDGAGVQPSIQSVRPGGIATPLIRSSGAAPLITPNDLAIGPDGVLCFTDSGSINLDPTVSAPGRLYTATRSGRVTVARDLPGAYPNGIAFDGSGRLYWTETQTRQVCRLNQGRTEVLAVLPSDAQPDGMTIAADGRIYVCTLTSGGVTVLSSDGDVLDHLAVAAYPTNCVFHGSRLIVTCTSAMVLTTGELCGSLWSVPTDACGIGEDK